MGDVIAMKTILKTVALAATTALVAFTVGTSPATAAITYTDELVNITPTGANTYDFSEGGFAGGAEITGSFTADGVNSFGQISSFDGDITAFSFSWSGNAVVPAFSGDLANLFGFVWDDTGQPLGTGTYGDIEGVVAFDHPGRNVWAAGPGPAEVCTGSNPCGGVESVPEPGAWALMLVGVGVVGAALRRRGRNGLVPMA